jgi:hypothetical protein
LSSVKVDKRLNRVTISITARNRSELTRVVEAVKNAVGELEPDLTCLTDFRKMGDLLLENGDLLQKAQQHLLKVGIGKAVRVLSPSQFNTPAYALLDALPTGYRYSYATSLREGRQILDNFRRELIHGTRKARDGKALFKYMDRSGWEHDTPVIEFDRVLRWLKKLREKGRKNAIIVDAGFKQRP